MMHWMSVKSRNLWHCALKESSSYFCYTRIFMMLEILVVWACSIFVILEECEKSTSVGLNKVFMAAHDSIKLLSNIIHSSKTFMMELNRIPVEEINSLT